MRRVIPMVLSLVVLMACDDSPTAVVDEPPPDAMLATFASMSAGPDGTYPCPDGGETAREGDFEQTVSGGIITSTFHATIEHRSCAVRIDQLVLTIDGTIAIDGIDRREWDGNAPGAIIENTTRQVGTLRWRTSDGYDRTCATDLTMTLDPATNVRRLVGSLCGDTVDFELTLP
jgi:hypothetical protein